MNIWRHVSQIVVDLGSAFKQVGIALFDAGGREHRYSMRVIDRVIKKLERDESFTNLPEDTRIVAIGDSGEFAVGTSSREALDTFRKKYGDTIGCTLYDPFSIRGI